MNNLRNLTRLVLAAAILGGTIAVPARADAPRTDAVSAVDIQARIDRQIAMEAVDRQAVEGLLQRPDVRRIAGTAGIDLARVHAAAGTLTGAELATVAARVDELNAGTGGVERVTLTVTTIIIVLLLIIILAG